MRLRIDPHMIHIQVRAVGGLKTNKKEINIGMKKLINMRSKAMTQHKQMIDEARMLLNTERQNIPSMSKDFSKEYWLLTYPCGKIIKTYEDKRKNDVVIQESYT